MSIEAESRRILSQITHETIDPSLPLGELLKDGVLLCKFLRVLKEESVGAFYLTPSTPTQQLNNCKQALKAITRGFKLKAPFSAKDIRDGTHGGQIARYIVLLVRVWGGNAQRLSLKLRTLDEWKRGLSTRQLASPTTAGEHQFGNNMAGQVEIEDNNNSETQLLLEVESGPSTKQRERDSGKTLTCSWSLLDLRMPWKRVHAAEGPRAVELLNLNVRRMRAPQDKRWRNAHKRRSLQGVVMVGAYRRALWQDAEKKPMLLRSFSDNNVSLSSSRIINFGQSRALLQ